MHHVLILFMHHIDCYVSFFLTVSDAVCLGFFFCFCPLSLFCLSFLLFSIMVRKTRAHKTSFSSSAPSFDSERFLSKKNQETFEKLNIRRNVWAKRKVVLDELDSKIRKNFERRGWLPLLDVHHPPSATLIIEFYSNLLTPHFATCI